MKCDEDTSEKSRFGEKMSCLQVCSGARSGVSSPVFIEFFHCTLYIKNYPDQ